MSFNLVNEGSFDQERWEYVEQTYSRPMRIWRGLVHFCRRKPLGAFGAVILLIPVCASIFAPGFDLGPLHFPRLSPYGHNEYTLGKEILEAPSGSHIMGTDHLGAT